MLSVDAAIGVPTAITKGKALPFGIHTSGDAILAPERKAFAWGTGVVFYGAPRPVAPYAIAGTSLHFDQIRDRFSFGNVSPYGEVGLLVSIPSRYEEKGGGLILSLGLSGTTFFNYLVAGGETVDTFALLKLGIGFETE